MTKDKISGNVNIEHFNSCRSKRVCKSELAADLLALIDGFDVEYFIANSIKEMSKRKIEIRSCCILTAIF